MASKRLIMAGMILGSVIGAYVPALWGVGMFSITSIIFSLAGGIGGIWLTYQLTRRM